MHGANAAANSHIVISCPNITQGTVVWTPQFQDALGSECGVQMYDPVIVRYRNIRTGDTREEVLFELSASNFQWEPNDDGATARGGPKSTPKTGHITLMKARMAGGSGQESRIHIRWDDNMIVTEAEATGEFEWLAAAECRRHDAAVRRWRHSLAGRFRLALRSSIWLGG
jgi:hypothetical protein